MYYEIKIYKNGDKEWYINGRRHREDGPAVERASGAKEWWLNGNPLSKDQWFDILPETLKVRFLFNEYFIIG